MAGGRKRKIGIVGCGTIGSYLAQAIERNFSEQAELVAICDVDKGKAGKLQAGSSFHPQILDLDTLIECCDLIIESAVASCAGEVAQKTLAKGKDIMVMSVGGILQKQAELFSVARKNRAHLYIPSGAIAGLDAVQAAAVSGIDKLTLITRKPPKGLAGAPYISEHKIDLTKIKQETTIFKGTAAEAIKGFPQNINVCAALSLASGLGSAKTEVEITTSPDYQTNIHEVEVRGRFGRLVTRTENVPSPDNPKTSFLACLSAVATLRNILDVVKIGT